MSYHIYLLFTISWFLHIGKRIPILGIIRFDLILILILFLFIFINKSERPKEIEESDTNKIIKVLILFIIIISPFAEWPGSVINYGLPEFVKAIMFYFFTIRFIDTEKRLKIFLAVFLSCQIFRVFEPLYLHFTTGYWGSRAAYMGGEEFMDRLSGAPMDVVNPNGLAFIIDTIIPFLFFQMKSSWKNKFIFIIVTPILFYALMLTGSRSGVLGMLVIMIGIFLKSQNKLVIGTVIILGLVTAFLHLSPIQQDRYISIFDPNAQNAATSQGRFQGVSDDLEVAMRRPLTGHGLGTSAEANYHYRGVAQMSHNLYTEIAQEIGFVGLIIFILFIISIIKNFRKTSNYLKKSNNNEIHLLNTVNAMQVWLVMNIIFSFASYGFLSYEWYLFGGLSCVLMNLVSQKELILTQTNTNREPMQFSHT